MKFTTGAFALMVATFAIQVQPTFAILDQFFFAIESVFLFILCDVLNSSSSLCGPVPYRRILKEFDESELFEMMEGDERHRHLQKYEEKKEHELNLGLCDHHSSTWRGYATTHATCFHPDNQVMMQETPAVRKVPTGDIEPWMTPAMEGGTVLAEDPGIWSFDNFLTPEETSQLLELVDKYGNEKGLFGPCKHDKRSSQHAHPFEGKVCFKISPEHACEGPYDISPCNTPTEEGDSEFVSLLLSKFESMWPGLAVYPYAKFQLASGGTAPVDLHTDNEKIISLVLYLSDGGAKMIFPHAGDNGVNVTPKVGHAHTWLNVHEDGSRNPAADHAVQAHPADADGRLVMLLEIPTAFKLANF